jgi:DNA-binding transcriptional regulator YiaG|nr:helix-turn-helix domain-containing protein [Neorhizobium tomejilense]
MKSEHIRRAPHFSAEKIKDMRGWNRRSEEDFARALGVSVALYRRWEAGTIRPRGPVLRLFQIIYEKGFDFLLEASR